MHNCYYYLFVITILLKVYVQSMAGIRIDQSLYLINENLISKSISQKSIIDAYENGVYALEFDKDDLEALIEDTLKSNLPFCNIDVSYYYYDAVHQCSCKISNTKCNSVQIRILISYHSTQAERLYRYELVEEK